MKQFGLYRYPGSRLYAFLDHINQLSTGWHMLLPLLTTSYQFGVNTYYSDYELVLEFDIIPTYDEFFAEYPEFLI
jgi:hypothetical protein